MKIKLVKTYTKIIYFLLIVFLFSACTPKAEKHFKKANGLKNDKLYRQATSEYEQIVKLYPNEKVSLQAAEEAAHIAEFEIKDYKRTIQFLEFLVMKSDKMEKRIQAQEKMARIYFDQIQDYRKAITEFNKLIPHLESKSDQLRVRLMTAQALYYLGEFAQSSTEVENLLQIGAEEDQKFEALLLKANILVAKKQFVKAIDIYKELFNLDEKRAGVENLHLALALCYEELADYKRAIDVIAEVQKLDPQNEYYQLRIKRLSDRMANKPGAKGIYRK